jgi:hypothetical protein
MEEKRQRIIGDQNNIAKKIDQALNVIDLENKIFEATELQH